MVAESAQLALEIISDFVHDLDYERPRIVRDSLDFDSESTILRDASLEQSIVDRIRSWKIGKSEAACCACSKVGAGAAEYFFRDHSRPLKEIIGTMTTVMKWMDNLAEEHYVALASFQSRFYARQPQLLPIFDRFVDLMLSLYEHFELFVADQMISSAIGFVAGTALEIRALDSRLPVNHDAKLWPYFMRNLSGAPTMYSLACFPSVDHPDPLQYLHALPDMDIVTNFLNDVMSFYKEELDCEEHNYVSTRARALGTSKLVVLQETADEAVAAHRRVLSILKDTKARGSWSRYIQGYVAFHCDVRHYRLPHEWTSTL